MKSPISIENLQASILEIRGNKGLLDSDVAKIYGVETKRVNEAVKKTSTNFCKTIFLNLIKTRKTNWSEISTDSGA